MESDAIVLDTADHGESDLIITFFTQEAGRLSAIAKGAKRSKKRFVNKLELFTYLHIDYQQKNEGFLAFLNEAEIHAGFPNIRHSLEQYNIASIIREFLLLGIKDAEPDIHIFRLTLWALHQLDNREKSPRILVLFLIHFFDYIGYRPDFYHCSSCGFGIDASRRYRFNSASGQLICSHCFQPGKTGRALSYGTIKLIQNCQDQPLERLHRLKLSGAILSESLQLLHNFGRQIFQREIISWQILEQQNASFGIVSPFTNRD